MVFVIFLFVFSGQITINIRVLLNINRFHKRTKKTSTTNCEGFND